jgi:acetolactate synthase I/II/III large subunit
MATVVEVLVEAFEQAGTPFITGIPGEESLELLEAARQRGMRFILNKQEPAAAMMSAAWGEITGSPGVCQVTRAPGAANLVLGVTHAWMDRCPLIAITDQLAAPTYAVGLRQRLDQLALYRPITKWSTSINAKAVRQQVRRAIRTAVSDTPGPVHFDLLADERTKPAGDDYATGASPLPAFLPVMPDRSAMSEPLAKLKAARRPILLVGLGVFWSKASTELVKLAERLGAPVLTTPKTKGAIPEDHPLSAGCFFNGQLERSLINQADLIVTVGLETVEIQPIPWPYSTPVVSLSGVKDLEGPITATTEMAGDLKSMLEGLSQWAPEGSNWGERAARAFRQEVAAAIDLKGTGLGPHQLMEVARSVLPRNTIATCDVGASRLFSVPKWPVYAPRDFLASNAVASMGFSVPAAMAARLARPQQPVVAFTGDGSFMLAAGELHTSVRENLPIIVVLLDNSGLGVMSLKQDLKGIARTGTVLGGVDWEHLARAFGADSTTVDTEKGLGDALGVALKSGRTTLIAARMDSSRYVDQYKAMRGVPPQGNAAGKA